MFLLQGWEISALRVIKWLPISSRTWRSSTLVAGIQCILIWYKNAASLSQACILQFPCYSLWHWSPRKPLYPTQGQFIEAGEFLTPSLSSPFPGSSPEHITEILECSVVNVQRLPKHCDLAYWTSTAGLGKKEAIFLWLKAGTGS